MKENEQLVDNQLGTAPIGKLLLKLALPAITAQMINALYNIVDRIYIGRLPGEGSLAIAGLGVAFPIILIISAFSALVGMGGAPRAAIKMGEGDNDGAEKVLGNSTCFLLVLSAVLTVFFMLAKEPILNLFGASPQTLPYALDYLSIYLVGTVFVQLALGLNAFISAQGFASTSMMTVLIGAVINIVLDPILIYGCGMGVKGAALATIISQGVSALWVLLFLLGKKSTLRIKVQKMKLDPKVLLPVLALGVSPFIMQATESLVQLTFNAGMKQYGNDAYVGAMAILFSTMQVVMLPAQGLGTGGQPIISFNYGAKQYDRVKRTFKLMFIAGMCLSTFMWAICMFFPQVFVYMFSSDPELLEIGVFGIRIFMAGSIVMGAQFACQQTLVALGQAKISMFLALLRKIILLIPLALILPRIAGLGTTGLFLAEPVADVIAATVTTCTYLHYSKKLFAKTE